MKNICNSVESIFSQVEMMITNFPCISGKGYGSFSGQSFQVGSRSNFYGGQGLNSSGFMGSSQYNGGSMVTPGTKSYRFMTDNLNEFNRQYEGLRQSGQDVGCG